MRTRGRHAMAVFACAFAGIALAACTEPTGVQPPASAPASTTPAAQVVPPASAPTTSTAAPTYQSSWTLSLAATSCALWQGEMFPAQQLAAAAQLLGAARVADGQASPPAAELVTGFEADVTARCAKNGEQTVQEAADAVYAGTAHEKYSS